MWQYRESKGFKGGVRLELFVRQGVIGVVGGVRICGRIEKVKDLREVPGWNCLLGRGLSVWWVVWGFVAV